jgi:hypothetical protein
VDFIGFCHEKLERRKVKGFGNCWLLHCERVRICNNHVMLQVWLLEYPAVMHWMPWMLADFCGLQVDWKHGLFCSGRTASRPAMRLLNGWQYPLANLSKLVYIHVYTNIYIYINIHECVYIYIIYISFYCYLLRHPLANDIQCFESRVSFSTIDPPYPPQMDGSILSIFMTRQQQGCAAHL